MRMRMEERKREEDSVAYEWISRYGRRGAAKITIGFHVPYTQTRHTRRRVRMHARPDVRFAAFTAHPALPVFPVVSRRTLRRFRPNSVLDSTTVQGRYPTALIHSVPSRFVQSSSALSDFLSFPRKTLEIAFRRRRNSSPSISNDTRSPRVV